MGRYDFRPSRVHQTASRLLNAQRLTVTPPWHNVVGSIPPSQILVRTLPVQHVRKPNTKASRKPSKMFKPQTMKYEEDRLRMEFFSDHPWELARPRLVLENDGKDERKMDWSTIRSPGRPLDGESVVRRQMHLMKTMSKAKAYDQARKEFYRQRLQEDVERRVAKEEAMATGAYFGKTMMQIGTEMEDRAYERWKTWAQANTVELAQKRAGAST